MNKFTFEVETIEAGQRRAYGDSYYDYNVTSKLSEDMVKRFCTKVLRPSYPRSEMPDPFAGQLIKFEKITDNNKGDFLSSKPETYKYKCTSMYTG